MARPSGDLGATLTHALAQTGYNYPMDTSNPRPNSVCCGNSDDSMNRLALFLWRKARTFIAFTQTAAVSLTMGKGTQVINQNGPDEVNPVTGGVDGLSDQFLEEKGALVPTDCYFAIIGWGCDVLDPFQTPVPGQVGAGDPTYAEFLGSELAQPYSAQLKKAILRHFHIEIKRKGNACTFATGDLAQLPPDAGVMGLNQSRAGQPFTNQFAFMRSPVIVSGVNESGALQINLVSDHAVTISSHAANPVPAQPASTQSLIPLDVKMYGVSLSPAMGCA